jgi:quercetin dioxygenase-like cupin family protein
VYVVLAGSLVVSSGGQEVTLNPLDSCCIPGGEAREVKNLGNEVATMLVVMPYPEGPQ